MERRSREEARQEFKDRLKDEQNKQDGGYYSKLFVKDVKIPFLKLKEGSHTIDILDYVAGKNDPKPNKLAWVFEFFMYQNVGAGTGPMLCLSKTFGLPDPIAEDRARQLREGVEYKKLSALDPPSPRALFNVICADSETEEKKGIQVLHTSSWLLTNAIRELAKGSARHGQNLDSIIDFCDPAAGKSIKFTIEGQKEKTKWLYHMFVDRPEGFVIPNDLLDKVYTLDELIHIPTYEEVQVYYYGKGQHQPSEKSLGESKPKEETLGSEVRRGRYSQQEASPVKEEVKKEEPKVDNQNPCPCGHTFAVDIDKFMKDCEPCVKWKECSRAKQTLSNPSAVLSVADLAPKQEEKKQEAPVAAEATGRTRRQRG